MRAPVVVIVSSLLILEILPVSAHAQLVDVAEGYVRAPFVRLQRRGRLRARRQTPDNDVEAGARAYQQPAVSPASPATTIQPPPVPPALPPQASQRAVPPGAPAGGDRVDWQQLRRTIILGETELDQQLTTSASAAGYRRQLHIGRLRELLLKNTTTAPTGETRQQLQEILTAYNQTLIDPQQRPVNRLSGFEKVQAGLMRLLAPTAGLVPAPDHVSFEQPPTTLVRPGIRSGEPQPTQVLPAVRDSY